MKFGHVLHCVCLTRDLKWQAIAVQVIVLNLGDLRTFSGYFEKIYVVVVLLAVLQTQQRKFEVCVSFDAHVFK